MSNTQDFVYKFNDIDNHLRDLHQVPRVAAADNRMILQYQSRLHLFSELRNIIVHNNDTISK